MADKILHKRSLTSGSIPTTSSLEIGELAINVNDGKLFLYQSGSIANKIVNVGESASFATTASYAISASFLIGGVTIDTGSFVTTSSFNIFTSSYTTGSFTGSFYGNGSNLEMATPSTGVVVSFSASYIYNSPTSAGTGSITDNLTGAKLGIIQKIYHNSGSSPTLPAGWVKLGIGEYVPSTLNIIYAEWVSGSRVEYWIVQGS